MAENLRLFINEYKNLETKHFNSGALRGNGMGKGGGASKVILKK